MDGDPTSSAATRAEPAAYMSDGRSASFLTKAMVKACAFPAELAIAPDAHPIPAVVPAVVLTSSLCLFRPPPPQVDANMSSGSSGGPIVNADGEVVGVSVMVQTAGRWLLHAGPGAWMHAKLTLHHACTCVHYHNRLVCCMQAPWVSVTSTTALQSIKPTPLSDHCSGTAT